MRCCSQFVLLGLTFLFFNFPCLSHAEVTYPLLNVTYHVTISNYRFYVPYVSFFDVNFPPVVSLFILHICVKLDVRILFNFS